MRKLLVKKGVLSVLTMFWPVLLMAQNHELPSPKMASDPTGNPPPPGLVVSIDPGIPLLLVIGLGMGIWFLKKKESTGSIP